MDIIEYLSETEYAVKNIINLISHDKKSLNEYLVDLNNLKKQLSPFEELYKDYVSKDISDDFCDLQVMYAAQRYYNYEEKNRDKKQKFLTEINILSEKLKIKQSQLDTRKFSIKCLCGAMLQIAKQGLSICYGKEESCVEVKRIAGERISNIIFQARNQSIHFEESLNNKVISCFNNLEQQLGNNVSIDQAQNINLADVIVIDVLVWNSYDNFYTDMIAFKNELKAQ
jgi:hypothetical protein